jgi:hypothetical protein
MMKLSRAALPAVLALALALAACGGKGDDDAAPATTTTTRRAATTSTSTSSTAPSRTVADAKGTAKRWLTAVAQGDDATALGLLSSRSLAKIGGPDGWKKMKIELAEGWGAWGRAEGVEMTAQSLPFPKDVAVVVLHGEVSQEGPPQESWNALPIIATADGDRVEAFLDVADVSVDPKEGGDLNDADELKITTSTSDDVFALIDDQAAAMPELRDVDASGAHWGLVPPSLDPGLHAVTVVVAGNGIQATRFEYTIGA